MSYIQGKSGLDSQKQMQRPGLRAAPSSLMGVRIVRTHFSAEKPALSWDIWTQYNLHKTSLFQRLWLKTQHNFYRFVMLKKNYNEHWGLLGNLRTLILILYSISFFPLHPRTLMAMRENQGFLFKKNMYLFIYLKKNIFF